MAEANEELSEAGAPATCDPVEISGVDESGEVVGAEDEDSSEESTEADEANATSFVQMVCCRVAVDLSVDV
jgi:hypothetical protein